VSEKTGGGGYEPDHADSIVEQVVFHATAIELLNMVRQLPPSERQIVVDVLNSETWNEASRRTGVASWRLQKMMERSPFRKFGRGYIT
jgi:hypothetical protein